MARKRSRGSGGKWIQEAIQHPGALRAEARKEGAITKRGTIDREWLREKAKEGGVTGRRARLALTLSKLRPGGAKSEATPKTGSGGRGGRKRAGRR